MYAILIILSVYFIDVLTNCIFIAKCCAMEGNCETMAVMAATLANGGICPITEEKVLKPESVRDVLSLMHSCGMYDYSGQFAFKVSVNKTTSH